MTPSEPEESPHAPDGGSAPARPDWLVGAEEGVDAELSRKPAETPKPPLRLIKPGGDAGPPGEGDKPPAPRAPAGDSELTLDSADGTAAPAEHTGGSREIELASDPSGGTATGGREALRITDLKAKRDARAAEKAAPAKKTAWTAAASSVPKLRLVESKPAAPPSHAASAHADDEPQDESGAFPDDLPPPGAFPASAPQLRAVAQTARAKTVAPSESWWLVALDRVRYERRLQLLIGVLIAAVIALMVVQSGGGGGTSISQIHNHPEKYDGRSVTVQGQVGEVFSVGGGYAFYLHQGRDTLVVFTRTRLPVSKQKVSVKGSISTGFLDGEPRQSLFEGN